MATKTYNIDINVQSKTLGQLENQLAQVNEELKQVDRNSEAFKNLTKEAQSLNAEIKRTNTEIEGFTFEKKIEAADGADQDDHDKEEGAGGDHCGAKFEEEVGSILYEWLDAASLREGLLHRLRQIKQGGCTHA